MAEIMLSGDCEFSVEHSDENEEIVFILEAGDDTVRLIAGGSATDAADLASQLRSAAEDADTIADDWEETPDQETDGIVYETSDGYTIDLEGAALEDLGGRVRVFPTQDIAIYELARAMTDRRVCPDAWYVSERGDHEPIGSHIYTHLIDDEDKLRPPTGAKYSQGDVVSLAGDGWPTWTVDGDYGEYGVMIHAQGDPAITHVAAHDDLTPYSEHEQMKNGDDEEDGCE